MILDTERGADVRYGGIAPKESQKLAEEINRAGGRLHILVHPFYRLSSASKGYRRSLQRVLTVVPEVPVVIAECVRDPDDARDDRWMQRLQRNFAALNANWESVGCIPFEANHPSPKFSAIPFDQEREPYLAHLWEHREKQEALLMQYLRSLGVREVDVGGTWLAADPPCSHYSSGDDAHYWKKRTGNAERVPYRLGGCVGSMLAMLARQEFSVRPSTVAYPLNVHGLEQIEAGDSSLLTRCHECKNAAITEEFHAR